MKIYSYEELVFEPLSLSEVFGKKYNGEEEAVFSIITRVLNQEDRHINETLTGS